MGEQRLQTGLADHVVGVADEIFGTHARESLERLVAGEKSTVGVLHPGQSGDAPYQTPPDIPTVLQVLPAALEFAVQTLRRAQQAQQQQGDACTAENGRDPPWPRFGGWQPTVCRAQAQAPLIARRSESDFDRLRRQTIHIGRNRRGRIAEGGAKPERIVVAPLGNVIDARPGQHAVDWNERHGEAPEPALAVLGRHEYRQ